MLKSHKNRINVVKGFLGNKKSFPKFDSSTRVFKRANNWYPKKSGNQEKGKTFYPKMRVLPAPIDRKFNLCLWVRQTYNNIFLTITDSRGRVRFVISGGFSKLRGNNRASHRSIEIITRILLKKLHRVKIKRLEFRTLCVFLTTPKNSVIKSLLRLLTSIPKIRFIAARLRIDRKSVV